MVLSMEKWEGKVAVVTGTTSGIGKVIATQLVEAGLQVVGLARRSSRNEELAKILSGKKGKFHPLTADITKEEDVLKSFKWIAENLGSVSILINNAGTKRSTSLIDGDTKMWQETFDINVQALCLMTREAVRNMRKDGISGHIVHINSMAAHRVPSSVNDNNVYPASKYAVRALTETLRQELNTISSKIRISSVSPGIVDTEIFEVSGMKDFLKFTNSIPKLLPEDIADTVMYILSTPPHVQIHDILVRPQGQAI